MNLKKLPLAIAIASAIAAPVASAEVTIYGKLYPYIVTDDGSGATAAGTSSATLGAAPTGVDAVVRNTGMVAGNSRWGIRGDEDIGAGMKAFFQLEGVVGVNNGTAGSGTSFWNRDTFVGLEQKGMGTLKLGLMDTIFKNYGDTIGILGISSGTFMSTSNILRKPGFGTSSAARFHERRANSIQVESAEFSGFQGGLQYSFADAKTDTRNQTTTSMGVKWDNGPFYVALAYEIHDDYFGGSSQTGTAAMRNTTDQAVNSKDTATQFTFEYRLAKNHRFEFDWIQKNYDENATVAGRFQNYKNNAYLLAMENRWSDQWRTAANFVRSDAGSCARVAAVCSTDGLDGSKFTLGAAYYLSKRTFGFASIARLTNGNASRFTTSEAGAAPNTNPGEDLTQFAIGLSHTF
jgi:predicted porin